MSQSHKRESTDGGQRYVDIPRASDVRLVCCDKESCDCGQVFIELYDCDGKCFAIAAFETDVALDIAGHILDAVEDMAGRGKVVH